MLLALVVIAAFGAGLVWVFRHLPWWGSLAVVLGLIVIGRFAVGRLITWALSLPFKWKGAVLKGASVLIHSVSPAENAAASTRDDESEQDASAGEETTTSRERYLLDATVTPNQPPGKFTQWAPGELVLVKTDSQLRLHGKDDEHDSCRIKCVEVEEDGQFKEDDGCSYAGPQRIKLLLEAQPGIRRLKFRYYFERFGEVELPGRPGTQSRSGSNEQQAA